MQASAEERLCTNDSLAPKVGSQCQGNFNLFWTTKAACMAILKSIFSFSLALLLLYAPRNS